MSHLGKNTRHITFQKRNGSLAVDYSNSRTSENLRAFGKQICEKEGHNRILFITKDEINARTNGPARAATEQLRPTVEDIDVEIEIYFRNAFKRVEQKIKQDNDSDEDSDSEENTDLTGNDELIENDSLSEDSVSAANDDSDAMGTHPQKVDNMGKPYQKP